jgi:hypothetical protein
MTESASRIGKEGEGSDQLASSLAALPAILAKRIKELDERERQLEKAFGRLESTQASCSGDAKPSDVLHLNIGGTKTAALRRTLTSVPGSMLATRFSGRWDDSIEKDRDGNFFIDQPFELFEPMLNYLRLKACENSESETLTSPSFKDNPESRQSFRIMVEYYGMTLGIFPVKMRVLQGLEYINNSIEYFNDLEARCNSFLTLNLRSDGHSMPIESYEVTIGQVESLQIGWESDSCNAALVAGLPKGQGVGDVVGSVGIDLIRSGIVVDGNFQAIEGLTATAGCVVRCEDFGNRWYFKGRLIASYLASDSVVLVRATTTTSTTVDEYPYPFGSVAHTRSVSPAISVKGSFEVSNVSYYKFG